MKQSYFENVSMPSDNLKIKSFLAPDFEYSVNVHPHWHNEIEMLLILKGNAMQQVNDQFFTVETGDIVIIGENQLHSIYSYQGVNCEILVIMFDKYGLIEDCQKQAHIQSKIFEKSMLFHNPIKSENEPGNRLASCLFNIHVELNEKKPGYQFSVKSLLFEISTIIIRNELFSIIESTDNFQFTKSMLENTFRLIDESFYEEINLQKAASASNLSISHFCRLFQKTTGMTFNAYLNFYRVNKAEQMLKTHESITAIAYDCGFRSISTFIRNFRKYKNCAPNELRSF